MGAGTGPWLHRLSEAWQRRLASAVCAAMLCSAVLRFGVPSIAGVARSYRALGGSTSIEANTLRCTHVAGSYWRVWPTVFAANIKRYEMGFEPPLLGVTDRAQQTIHLWPDDALSWRICVPPGDAVAMAYVQGIEHIQFVRVKRGAHLDVLSAKSSTVTP